MNAEDVSKWLGAISEASDAPEHSRQGEGCVSKEAWMKSRGVFLVNAPEEVKYDATVMAAAVKRWGGNALKWAGSSLLSDPQFMLNCLKIYADSGCREGDEIPLVFASPALLGSLSQLRKSFCCA
jgi:hypothetical protein